MIAALVAARKAAGLTQRDLAAKLKQQPSYIGKVESLQRRLDVIEFVEIADALDMKAGRLLTSALSNQRVD